MADLHRLSDKEREVLRLLAQGHTAKSAAAVLGISVNSVNERLRDARAKMGDGSSRELARRLGAEGAGQDRWDNDLGVAPHRPSPAWRWLRAGGVYAPWRDVLAMTILAGATGAVTTILLSGALAARPRAPAHVVSTFPASGARVKAGAVSLRVTFDRPMRAGSYSYVVLEPSLYPYCARTAELSAAARTFTLACRLAPRREYEIGLNTPPFQHFVAADTGEPAAASVLRFSTR